MVTEQETTNAEGLVVIPDAEYDTYASRGKDEMPSAGSMNFVRTLAQKTAQRQIHSLSVFGPAARQGKAGPGGAGRG